MKNNEVSETLGGGDCFPRSILQTLGVNQGISIYFLLFIIVDLDTFCQLHIRL